jgi:hypothetical protein
MRLLPKINQALASTTGLQVRRVPAARGGREQGAASTLDAPAGLSRTFRPPQQPEIDRLLKQPVFILSPVRSGSTLLRMLLSAHSRLHAPHELHLRWLEVTTSNPTSERAMKALGLHLSDLEHLLWDRVLHRELAKSGKDFIVEKTPGNAFAYERFAACWPDARFIVLLRHPVSIARSWHESDPVKRPYEDACAEALEYMAAVQKARQGLSGTHLIRYEDLTVDPQSRLRELCAFLNISFERSMLDYGKRDRSQLERGLGDWREKIQSGKVQPGRALPAPEGIPDTAPHVRGLGLRHLNRQPRPPASRSRNPPTPDGRPWSPKPVLRRPGVLEVERAPMR